MDNTRTMELCPNMRRMETILNDEEVTCFQMYSPAATLMSREDFAGLFVAMHGRMSSPDAKDAMKMEFF